MNLNLTHNIKKLIDDTFGKMYLSHRGPRARLETDDPQEGSSKPKATDSNVSSDKEGTADNAKVCKKKSKSRSTPEAWKLRKKNE